MRNVTVVRAVIERLGDEPNWKTIDVDSAADAMRLCPDFGDITLIGTAHPNREVAVYYARSGPNGFWRDTSASHMTLALYLLERLSTAPRGVLKPFFDAIDDTRAAQAARWIIGSKLEWSGATPEQIRDAVLSLNRDLDALGVPTGDWSFEPIYRAALQSTALDLLTAEASE